MLLKIQYKSRPWQSQQFPVSINCSWWLIFRGRTKWFMWCLIFKVCLTLDFKFTEYTNVPSFFRPKPNCRQNCSIGRESWSPLLPCCRLSVAWWPLTPFQHVFKSGNSNQCTIMKHYPFSILQVLCIASVKKVLYPLHGVLLIQMLPSNHTDQNRAGPGLVMLPKQLLNTFISHQNSSVVTFQVIFCLTPMLKNEQQEGRD